MQFSQLPPKVILEKLNFHMLVNDIHIYLSWHKIRYKCLKHRNAKPKGLKALEENVSSINEDPSVAKDFKNKTSFRICIRSWSCATVLQTQNPPGENWSPRNADKPVSIVKTTTSAQRNLSGALRTQELSGFQLFLELILCHSAPYSGFSWRELVLQEY